MANSSPQLATTLSAARAGVATELLADTVVLHGDVAAELAAVSAELDLLITGSRGYGPSARDHRRRVVATRAHRALPAAGRAALKLTIERFRVR